MANLRYCSFCGALKASDGSCDCTTAPSSGQRGGGPERSPGRDPRRPVAEREYNFAKLGIGVLILVVIAGVCSYMVDRSPENGSAQSEANNLAVYQRMDIHLGDCYRWLLRFDDQKRALIAQGHGESSAEAVAIDDQRRDYTYGEYRAILQRCGVLWGQATEQEKVVAVRESGVR